MIHTLALMAAVSFFADPSLCSGMTMQKAKKIKPTAGIASNYRLKLLQLLLRNR